MIATRRAYEETGNPVHLIGHSLGGVIARASAVRWSDKVASVTTMASPFRGVRVHPFVLQTAYLVRGRVIQRRGQSGAVKEKTNVPNCFSGFCTCEFLNSGSLSRAEELRRDLANKAAAASASSQIDPTSTPAGSEWSLTPTGSTTPRGNRDARPARGRKEAYRD